MTLSSVVFVGGGNMAGALVGGLVRSGWAPEAIRVIEPEPRVTRPDHAPPQRSAPSDRSLSYFA